MISSLTRGENTKLPSYDEYWCHVHQVLYIFTSFQCLIRFKAFSDEATVWAKLEALGKNKTRLLYYFVQMPQIRILSYFVISE